ncbi:hypothetical protein D3C79_887480 [compost metagenome]
MFFGGIGRLEAQLLSDLRPCWREAVVFEAAFDEGEDFGLAWRQFQHGVRSVFLYSDWDYIQWVARCKHRVSQAAGQTPLTIAERVMMRGLQHL